MSAQEPPQRRAPWLRIVRGDPSPEELAALVAVLAARAAASRAAASRPTPASGWTDRAWGLRSAPLPRGSQGWRASAWPR
ncbi:MAG: acyl-CoA carboxylase subunit epsilon [Actinomycetota bacterium]|nr:acyl-CoA carboxylase subunit epsilon [Acidothermales bacterium]MDQ3430923.1 acyl-CoA carboxylase subunit epsilon [Actinomycetota bacterium]